MLVTCIGGPLDGTRHELDEALLQRGAVTLPVFQAVSWVADGPLYAAVADYKVHCVPFREPGDLWGLNQYAYYLYWSRDLNPQQAMVLALDRYGDADDDD